MSSYLRQIFAFLLLLTASLVSAQSRLDLSLIRTLERSRTKVALCSHDQKPQEIEAEDRDTRTDNVITVLAILHPTTQAPITRLESMGIGVGSQVGRVLTLRVPVSQLEALSALPAFESISANRNFQVSCLNTRIETNACYLQENEMPYTGKGVLLGVIDTGIEYNHLNFRTDLPNADSGESPATQSSTRIRGAILYRPEEGAADSIREYYTEPWQIDTLTTDNPYNAHGTHTAGVAGGSYRGLRMQGMAPDADLMLCGTSVLEEDRLIDALQQTFARAEELGEPCVVNLSIGNPIGWKDGLSPFNLVCEALTEGGNAPGRAIVISAGNDGEKNYTVQHVLQDTLPVYTLLQPVNQRNEKIYFNPNLDVYSSDSRPLSVEYLLYDTLQRSFRPLPFEQHLLDTLEAGHNNRRHLIIDCDTCRMNPYPHCYIAGRLQGQPGTEITLYYINNESVSYPLRAGTASQYTWLRGTPDGSINDLCCTPAVLSVGAYSAVDSLVNIFGRTLYPYSDLGQVCGFSSYGYTWQGQPLPDVICPGASVISSFSRFWEDKIAYYYTNGKYPDSPMMYAVTPSEEGPSYYWSEMQGTSQSSPVLAGIIALWMQACPTLSVRQIREVLACSSRFDDACLHAPSSSLQAGMGKVDAAAGQDKVLALAGLQAVETVCPASSVTFDIWGRKVLPAIQTKGLMFIDGVKVWQR